MRFPDSPWKFPQHAPAVVKMPTKADAPAYRRHRHDPNPAEAIFGKEAPSKPTAATAAPKRHSRKESAA